VQNSLHGKNEAVSPSQNVLHARNKAVSALQNVFLGSTELPVNNLQEMTFFRPVLEEGWRFLTTSL